jgi:hypothetical protein
MQHGISSNAHGVEERTPTHHFAASLVDRLTHHVHRSRGRFTDRESSQESFHGGIYVYSTPASRICQFHAQGQDEGQVKRLKLLKRQSYGRANLDLLRCRLPYDVT